jgi:hypothetical protein
MTHHGPGSGGATTILPIVFPVPLHRTCIRMTLFPRIPKVESRNYLGFGLLGLWDIIASRPNLRSGRGLNQTCSPLRELSNAVLHSPSARWERVDSRLLVVGSQTASLTSGPSFAHNLGCKCPNDQCKAILDIYTLRPFQWPQEHPNARCFAFCCRTLNIREPRRTPNPQLWECEFHPHTWPKWGCDNILVHYVSIMHCFIVFQEIKTSTLYNIACKEEWEFKKNNYAIFNRSIILWRTKEWFPKLGG